MGIKRFCDSCGIDMDGPTPVLTGMIGRWGKPQQTITVVVGAVPFPSRLAPDPANWVNIGGVNAAPAVPDFCKNCVLDALGQMDDRPGCSV